MNAQEEARLLCLNDLQEIIGDNGMIAFEHRFKRPIIEIYGTKYTITMISDKEVYGFDKDKTPKKFSLKLISLKALTNLIKAINAYTIHCSTMI